MKKSLILLITIIFISLCLSLVACSTPTYSIVYDYGYDTETIEVKEGEHLPEIPVPVRDDGYRFSHWTLDGETFDYENHIVKGDLTIVAVWEKSEIVVEIVINDSKTVKHYLYDGGGVLPQKYQDGSADVLGYNDENYDFAGYYRLVDGKPVYVSPDTKFTENTTLYIDIASKGLSITDGGVILKYNGTKHHIIIPNFYHGVPVIEIGENAFYAQNINGVTFSQTLRKISQNAFLECVGVGDLYIPANIEILEKYAFSSNDGKHIGSAATKSVTAFVMDENSKIKVLPSGLLLHQENLSKVILADSVTTIEDGVFHRAYALKNIVLPKNVTAIGREAFNMCHSLQSIVIEGKLTSLGNNIFTNCQNLTIYVNKNSHDEIKNINENWNMDGTKTISTIYQARKVKIDAREGKNSTYYRDFITLGTYYQGSASDIIKNYRPIPPTGKTFEGLYMEIKNEDGTTDSVKITGGLHDLQIYEDHIDKITDNIKLYAKYS